MTTWSSNIFKPWELKHRNANMPELPTSTCLAFLAGLRSFSGDSRVQY
jgi:hypothetical protein